MPLRWMRKSQWEPLETTGGAHGGDGLALVHVVAHRDVEVAVVAVPCDKAVAVIDLHAVAQAAVPSGVDDGSAVGGVDRRAVGVAISMAS